MGLGHERTHVETLDFGAEQPATDGTMPGGPWHLTAAAAERAEAAEASLERV